MNERELQHILDFAVEIADAAGTFTLGYFSAATPHELKSDHTPVTLADRGAEERLRRRIEAAFPTHGIIGEEFGEKTGYHARPLDPGSDRRDAILHLRRAAVQCAGRLRVGRRDARGRHSPAGTARNGLCRKGVGLPLEWPTGRGVRDIGPRRSPADHDLDQAARTARPLASVSTAARCLCDRPWLVGCIRVRTAGDWPGRDRPRSPDEHLGYRGPGAGRDRSRRDCDRLVRPRRSRGVADYRDQREVAGGCASTPESHRIGGCARASFRVRESARSTPTFNSEVRERANCVDDLAIWHDVQSRCSARE